MSLSDRITVNPAQCGGRPCIRGMRIRVTDVLELLAAGLTPDEVVEELPDLEPDDIRGSLLFAARRMDHPVEGGRIVVTPLPLKYDLDELIGSVTDRNRHDETDWGPSSGAE